MKRRSFNSRGFASVLQNPRFLIFWLGEGFSQLADKIYLIWTIALTANLYQAQGQSISGWVSAIMIAFTLPAVLFGSIAGVYVDRWPKKGILVHSNSVRGFLTFLVPLLLWTSQQRVIPVPLGWLPSSLRFWDSHAQEVFSLPLGFLILLSFTFINSTITQFFAPAEQVTIPLIVRRHDLLAANSLFTTTMMFMTIVGFAIGEPLLGLAARLSELVDLSWQVGKAAVVGGAYLLASLILARLRLRERRLSSRKAGTHFWEDMREGINYLAENQRVRDALAQLVILFSIFAALSVLAVRMAETLPGLKAEQFGWLLAAAGAGMVAGAGFVGNWGQNLSRRHLSFWGSLGMALSLLGLSLSTRSLWLTLMMAFWLGIFAALVGVPIQTTIQEETPVKLRGKVFGLQNNAVNLALSLPLALAGLAETFFGLRPVLLSLAGLALAGGIFLRGSPVSPLSDQKIS